MMNLIEKAEAFSKQHSLSTDAAEELKRLLDDARDAESEDQIALVWGVFDVKYLRPDLSKKECREVLETVKDDHDATLGVTWATLCSLELCSKRPFISTGCLRATGRTKRLTITFTTCYDFGFGQCACNPAPPNRQVSRTS